MPKNIDGQNGANPGRRTLNLGCGQEKWGTDRLDWDDYGDKSIMKFNLNSGKPLPFKDKTFDEVRLHYVIQHLLYSQEVLEECGRVLKKGGELDLTFPDCESLFYWLFPIRDNPVRGGGPHMTNGSSYGIWNVNMMTNRLRAAGFRVAETTKYGRSATNLFLSNPAVHMRCIKE